LSSNQRRITSSLLFTLTGFIASFFSLIFHYKKPVLERNCEPRPVVGRVARMEVTEHERRLLIHLA